MVTTYHYNLSLLFYDILNQFEEKPALRYADRHYTYSDLKDMVEALSNSLLERNYKRGDVIAIGHDKRPLSYALMLAALRLGIAYVNIDVASPVTRNRHILDVSGATLLFYDNPIYQESMSELVNDTECDLLFLDEVALSDVTDDDRAEQLAVSKLVDGACIAYVMFTSGSTGIPKGVAVTHQNVLHFIAWGQSRFNITDEDNFANLSPMYFDNSVFDFYIGLYSGASLSPVYRELLTSPYDLVQFINQLECTIWFSVPSLLMYLMAMKALKSVPLTHLRHIIFGGEGYPKIELKKLFDLFSDKASLVNVYGPTECTCICSAYTLTVDDFSDLDGFPTLGKLNPNFDYSILDDQDHESNEGELCLIGPNVASGYFNDVSRSAESFFTLTSTQRYMKRMYRTGDLVKEEHGNLYFIGRKDNQIKHMGYRIELEEIEHALIKLAQIDQAAVIYQRTTSAYGKLIGFVATTENVSEKDILAELAKALPSYMIPSRIISKPQLPKNPNGKVDRHQLRALISSEK